MKRFNIFATMALAMVLGLGAAIGIGSGTKEFRNAEAAGSKTMYLDFNGISGIDSCCLYMKGVNQWPGEKLTDISGYGTVTAIYGNRSTSKSFYKFDINTSATEIALTHSNGSAYWNNKWDITSAIDASWNLVQYSDWGDPGSYNAHHMHKIEIVDSGSTTYEYNPAEWGAYHIPTHSGSGTFDGWYINGDTSTTKFNDNGEYGMPTDNINDFNFTAVYKATPKYTVSTSITPSDYGTVSPSSISNVTSGTSYSVSGNNLIVGSTTITPTPHATADGWNYSFNSWTLGGSAVTSGTITGNTTFVATFTRSRVTYTIKYDRNKNDGTPQVTQTKTHGANVNAYTPGTSAGMTGDVWNPSLFKRFTHWNTSYDDKGDNVSAGATISSNASFWLYYIEDWMDYRYKINSGSWIDLTYNSESIPSGVTAQFKSSNQELPLNAKLYFQYSNNGGTTWNDLTINTYEGNYDSSTGIKMQTNDALYLKGNNDGSYSVWVPGESDRIIGVCNTSSATTGTFYGMRSTGYTETITTTYVNIQKDQYLRRGWQGVLYETYLLSGGASTYFTQMKSGDKFISAKCNMTGGYTVYNRNGSSNNWYDVYIVRNDEASAKYLAQIFNNAVSAICSGITGGSKTLSDLQAIWGSVSSTSLYKNFNGQPAATMNYFKTSSTTTDTDILACVAKYDYVVKKYGTDKLPDFLGRANGYSANPQGRAMIALFGQDQKSMSTMIIVAVSSIATIGAFAGYFFYKKKKEDR